VTFVLSISSRKKSIFLLILHRSLIVSTKYSQGPDIYSESDTSDRISMISSKRSGKSCLSPIVGDRQTEFVQDVLNFLNKSEIKLMLNLQTGQILTMSKSDLSVV